MYFTMTCQHCKTEESYSMNDVYAKGVTSMVICCAVIVAAVYAILGGLTGFVFGGITGAVLGLVIDIQEAKRERKFNASVVTGWKPS